jgi:glycosyltransferase involved in cell wall biosynthesis
MESEALVTIILAAKNGEKFIGEQIESILQQSEKRWKLVIQDDVSTDATVEIAQKYAEKYPEKIILIKREIPFGSAEANFFSLLVNSHTPYTMFADQDDYWLQDKVETSLNEIQRLENKFGKEKPILVHTDLKVADEFLNIKNSSLFAQMNINPKNGKLNNIIARNIVTGNTAIINKALIDIIKFPQNGCMMYDWWIALVASAFGYIGFLNKATILYRQHKNNTIGAKNVNSITHYLKRIFPNKEMRRNIMGIYRQAQSFYNTYKEQLTEADRGMCFAFAKLPKMNYISRYQTLKKYDFNCSNFFYLLIKTILR